MQIPLNLPSLCIPRVFANITQDRIRNTFESLNLGDIERIDQIQVRDSSGKNQFQRVFIHFKQWNSGSETALRARDRILDNKEFRVIYDDPWFWKVSAYRPSPRPPSTVGGGRGGVGGRGGGYVGGGGGGGRGRSSYQTRLKKTNDPVIDFEFVSTTNHEPSYYQRRSVEPRTPSTSPPSGVRKFIRINSRSDSGSSSDTDSESDVSSFNSAVDAAVAAIYPVERAHPPSPSSPTASGPSSVTSSVTESDPSSVTASVTESDPSSVTASVTESDPSSVTASVTASVTEVTESVKPTPRKKRIVIKNA
jgi:hypothetical protein